MNRTAYLIPLLALSLVGTALAAGSRRISKEEREARAEKKAAAAKALELYEQGRQQSETGRTARRNAREASSTMLSRSLERRARAAFQVAVERYEEAVGLDGGLHQAWNELGYARRVLGDYETSLEAYEKALELKPGYAPAIEYRAEALLGLGRLDEVEQAYMDLFRRDRGLAKQLAEASASWVQARRSDPRGISPERLERFSGWLETRRGLASGSAAGSSNSRGW